MPTPLTDSLREILDSSITDPLEYNRRICKALLMIAEKLDNDTGVTDTNYKDSLNNKDNY